MPVSEKRKNMKKKGEKMFPRVLKYYIFLKSFLRNNIHQKPRGESKGERQCI